MSVRSINNRFDGQDRLQIADRRLHQNQVTQVTMLFIRFALWVAALATSLLSFVEALLFKSEFGATIRKNFFILEIEKRHSLQTALSTSPNTDNFAPRQSDSSGSVDSTSDESSKLRSNRPYAEPIPANLRRRIKARRPNLGHIVPKHARRVKGGSNKPLLQEQGKSPGLNNPSMLKISAGLAKGRRLDSPQVYLRPMMGKVREAVFSTLTSFGLYASSVTVRHLDVYAGSGSVGLESLSRGASHCTFVDLSPDCCACVERNVAWCNFHESSQATVICQDAFKVLKDPYKSGGVQVGQTFQIVTLCPPYEEVVYADLLDGVANCPCVTEDTVVLIEYPIELGCLPHVVARSDGGAMIGVRNRRYGRTVIAMYVVNPTGKLDSADSRPEEFVSLR